MKRKKMSEMIDRAGEYLDSAGHADLVIADPKGDKIAVRVDKSEICAMQTALLVCEMMIEGSIEPADYMELIEELFHYHGVGQALLREECAKRDDQPNG